MACEELLDGLASLLLLFEGIILRERMLVRASPDQSAGRQQAAEVAQARVRRQRSKARNFFDDHLFIAGKLDRQSAGRWPRLHA